MNEIFDVLIIGGGPGGMYSSIIGSLINVSSVIIESNPFLGGQPMQLYAEKCINDYPGFKEILTASIINGMVEQINSLDKKPVVYLNSNIIDIKRNDNIFITTLESGEKIKSINIIIATGSGNFLPIKSEALEEKKFNNIHYIFNGANIYKNKNITILGGGDSALDWANFLFENNISNNISIIHRRNEFRAREEKINKLNKNNINVYLNFNIEDIYEDKILIKCNKTNIVKQINHHFLIVQYGQKLKIMNEIKLFKELSKNENKKINVDINNKTNIENIYAIGNSSHFDSRPNLIISACADGARAIYHIRNKKKR